MFLRLPRMARLHRFCEPCMYMYTGYTWEACTIDFTNTYTFYSGVTNTPTEFTFRLIALLVCVSLCLFRSGRRAHTYVHTHARTKRRETCRGCANRPPNEEMLGRISEDHVLRITYIPTTPFGSTCLRDSLFLSLSLYMYIYTYIYIYIYISPSTRISLSRFSASPSPLFPLVVRV